MHSPRTTKARVARTIGAGGFTMQTGVSATTVCFPSKVLSPHPSQKQPFVRMNQKCRKGSSKMWRAVRAAKSPSCGTGKGSKSCELGVTPCEEPPGSGAGKEEHFKRTATQRHSWGPQKAMGAMRLGIKGATIKLNETTEAVEQTV